MGKHLLELSFADPVPVDDDAGRFELGGLVEGDQEFPDHGAELFYHLLTVLLYPHCRWVTAGVGVHTPHHGGYGGFAGISSWGVGHIGPQKDDWLTEHQGSGAG